MQQSNFNFFTHLTMIIPAIFTILPRDLRIEGGDQVEQGPSDDHVVIDGYEARHDEHAPSDT